MARSSKVKFAAVVTVAAVAAVAAAVPGLGLVRHATAAGPATAPDVHDAAATRPSANMKQVYKVFVGGGGRAFDTPDITADFADVGGVATVYVNGDPVCSLTDRYVTCPVNQYLANGENLIDVRGSFSGKVYLKLGQFAKPKNVLVGKQVFTGRADASPQGESVKFDVVLDAHLPEREVLSQDPQRVEQYKREIGAFVGSIVADLKAHDGPAATAKLEYGDILWDGALYNEPFTPEMRKAFEAFWGDKNNAFDPGVPAPSLTFGDRLVRVAVQPYDSDTQKDYSFLMHRGRAAFVVPPLSLARVAGKWCCWNS